jgi:hypothetical protein
MAAEFTGIAQKLQNAIRSDQVLRAALSTTFAVHKPRIFEQGFNAKGSKMGTYSTNPISIAANKQARNTGRTYFKGGYSEYKSAIGKNPGFVNLRNTDQMMGDYSIIGGGGSFGFGFHNNENYEKSQWMEDKYGGGIFDLSSYEENVLAETLTNLIYAQLG